MPVSTTEVLMPPQPGINQSLDLRRHQEDESRWLGIKDYSVFLNDGVLRSFGLVQCPFITKSDALSSPSSSTEIDIQSLKNSSSKTAELQERLLKLCSTSPAQLRRFHNFHFNIFQNMWLWKYTNAMKVTESSDNLKNPIQPSSPGLTASKLSLLLLVPLLKSQATIDPDLATNTARILLGLLLELPAMSLGHDFQAPLDQLESLFGEWIQQRGEAFQEIGMSVMVGLCCARGSLSSILKTIRLLQENQNVDTVLPVGKILQNLPSLEMRVGKACRISGCRHVSTWQYDDQLDPFVEKSETIPPHSSTPGNENTLHVAEKVPNWHGLAADGTYLFVSGIRGKGLAKIGTGLKGSLQGFLYHRNNDTQTDFIAFGNGLLIARMSLNNPESATDSEVNPYGFGTVIDQNSLTPTEQVTMRCEDELIGNCALIGMTSDGFYFYVVQVQLSKNEIPQSGPVDIYLSIFDISRSEDGTYCARLVRPHILLQREIDPEPVVEVDAIRRSNRLTYLAATVQPQPPPPPTSTPSSSPFADRMTSLGIRLRDLTSASYISNGNYLTIFTEYTPGSASAPTPAASPLLQSLNRHFGTGPSSLHNPKVTGTQIHVCLHGPTPICSKHPFEVLPTHCSFQRGFSTVTEVGFAYDAFNNLIWTASGNYADSWKNPGCIPPWKEKKQLMLQDVEFTPTQAPEIEVHKVFKLLWSHVGLQAHHFLDGCFEGSKSIFDEENLVDAWGIVSRMNFKTLHASELTALFVVIQTIISKVKVPLQLEEIEALSEIRALALSLFSDTESNKKFGSEVESSGVYLEASKLIVQTFEHLSVTTTERHQFATQVFQTMENESMDRNISSIFKTHFLIHLTKKLEADGVLYDKGQSWILPQWILRKLIAEDSVQHTLDLFDDYSSSEKNEAASVSLVAPATAYITSVVNCLLKSWALGPILNIPEDPDFPPTAVQIFKIVLNHSSTIVDRAIEFVTMHPVDEFHHFISTENILKTSLLGMTVPQIFMWLSEHSSNSHCDRAHPVGHGCPVVEEVSEACIQLYVAISHLSDKMMLVDQSGGSRGDGWSCHTENVYPFQNYRTYESIHPIKENSKLREAIVFTGAKRLYVKMDPRSATQYDYDKFSLFAGTGPSAQRVAEYGGNFYGFGNRSGMPSYWSRDLIKIDGDTVSYEIVIHSGKEQHTPPEAVWGFAFIVFPVYDSYTSPGAVVDISNRTQRTRSGLVTMEQFFIDKLSLAAVDTMSCMLAKLINGEPATKLEIEMPSLFSKNEIFSRLNFSQPNNPVNGKETFLNRISSEKVMELRHHGNSAGLPRMGNTYREIIHPAELEKLYVLACFKCLSPADVAENLEFIGPAWDSESSKSSSMTSPDVLQEMFFHVDSFIRKFITMAELQSRLKEELDEVLQGRKELRETFVYTLNAGEFKGVLEILALIMNTTFDKDDLDKTASDLRSRMEAFAVEGSTPKLATVEGMVEETILKLCYVLSTPNQDHDLSVCEDGGSEQAKQTVNRLHSLVFSHLSNRKATMGGIMEVIGNHTLRASSRCQGLQLLLKLLDCSQHNYQSVLMASLLLQQTKRTENISCSSLTVEVDDLTGRGINSVVAIAKSNPLLHRHAIALICTIPYKREDEKTLVSNGLLELLDELCGIQIEEVDVTTCTKLERGVESGRNSDPGTNKNTTSLAWAAFQVLAHCCSSWETDTKGLDELEWKDPQHVALPMQISLNVTNHLARATAMTQLSSTPSKNGINGRQACVPIQEGMQDVLTLLDILKATKLGGEILRQSPCICRLLVLLLDARQPPFVVLTIIRLLGTALPLVEQLDTSELHQMNIPLIKKKAGQAWAVNVDPRPHTVVVSLLLSKLADFLVVSGGNQSPLLGPIPTPTPQPAATEAVSSPEPGRHSILHAAFPPPIPFPLRTPPPVITIGQQGSSSVTKAKVLLSEQKCREKNSYLQNHDPARNFLSGEVAAGLAVEVTKLIRQLQTGPKNYSSASVKSSPSLGSAHNSTLTLTSPSSERFTERQTLWTNAVEQALVSSLKPLGKLTGLANPLSVSLDAYVHSARMAVAALGVVGSLDERIKIGSVVWVLGPDWSVDKADVDDLKMEFWPTRVRVVNFCERSGMAIVQYIEGENDHRDISPAQALRVPISRLSASRLPSSIPPLEISQLALREISTYLKNLFIPHVGGSKHAEVTFPLKKSLPTLNQILTAGSPNSSAPTAACDAKAMAQRMTVVRLIAEIRTRAAHVLSIWLKNPEFLEVFLGETDNGSEDISPDTIIAVNSLNEVAKECKASNRLQSVEGQVARLRLLYRDCTKPPRLPLPNQAPEDTRPPTAPACLLETPPTIGSIPGQPTTLRFRRISDSMQELDPLVPMLVGLGQSIALNSVDSDSEVSFSITDTESDDDGTSDYASPMSSRSNLPLEPLEEGIDSVEMDFAGSDDSESTINVDDEDDDIVPAVVPLLAEVEGASGNREGGQITTPPNVPAIHTSSQVHIAKPKPENKEYSPATVLEYYLTPSATYDIRVFSGPNPYLCPCSTKMDSESDVLSIEDDNSDRMDSIWAVPERPTSGTVDADTVEDFHVLLLRAWEAKVFPTIRRRFRNESERRDGLEQIRNALTLGMIDIARQTVEFLYEENGGIPRDLHLPTLEEVKAEASRVTMERIKVGMRVLLHPNPTKQKSDVQDSIIPKYAVSAMLKTFGLVGEVLDIDKMHELILVETYVESDGILQRFWYPIKSLERLAEEKKPPNSRTVNMAKLHSNLVALEASLTQLYCRKAYLEIMNIGFRDQNRVGAGSSSNNISTPSRSVSSLFEEVDLGNLEIRSEESFAEFPMNGDLLTCNLGSGVPSMEFLTEMGNPSVVFYKESEKLSAELQRSIGKAYRRSGAQGLLELTSRICSVMESAPHKFLWHEIPLEEEGSYEVRLPDMAFSLITVQGPLPKKNAPTGVAFLNKDPCVHVYASNGGDLRMWPLVCYPVQTLGALLKVTSSAYGSTNPGPGIRNRKMTAFPPVLVPTDRISCAVMHGSLPGHRLQVLGIPAGFPLALLYCQQLVTFLQQERSVPGEVPVHLLSILFDFLEKTSTPPLLKEWIFMLASGVLWTPSNSDLLQQYILGKSALVNRLFTEVVVLYEQETKLQTNLTLNLSFPFSITTSPPRRNTNESPGFSRSNSRQNRNRPMLIPIQVLAQVAHAQAQQGSAVSPGKMAINDAHSFPVVSSYFQSLLELCLNLTEGADLTYSPTTLSPALSVEPSPGSSPVASNAVVAMLETSRPTSQPQQRKALKTLKPSPPSPKSNAWKRVGKVPPPPRLDSKSPGTSTPPIKMEEFKLKNCMEMKWFCQAAYALNLLKTFGVDETYGKSSTSLGSDIVKQCLKEMKWSTSHGRLFVSYGAPNNIPNRSTETSVSRALNGSGGIYGNELWLSEDETELVVEIRTLARADEGFEALRRNLAWYPVEDFIVYPSVSVFRVNNLLETGNRRADTVLIEYLRQKIFSSDNPERLSGKATEVFSAIFTNCYVFNDNQGQFDKAELDETGLLVLKKDHILNSTGDENLMRQFVEAVKPSSFEVDYFVQEVLKKFGRRKNSAEKSSCSGESEIELEHLPVLRHAAELKKSTKNSENMSETDAQSKTDEGFGLSESGFLDWCTQLAKDNLCSLWRALLETGHDIRLDKCWVADTANLIHLMTQGGWTRNQDAALVTYVNQLASKLRVTPQMIHPHEIYLEEALFLDPVFKHLQNLPLEYVRTRFAILQHINRAVHHNLLPFVSLNFGKGTQTSIASLLHHARHLLFYHTKDDFLYKVFLNSAHRGHEISPPEVTLDPIRSIGDLPSEAGETMFSSAICQLSQVPSQMFCVIPATGSDPPLPIVVKFTGEEVQGVIGSFRHFLARTIQEFQESALSFLIPCPSSAAGKNKDSLILRPGPLTYGEEKFLQCMGQFIGVCLRSDVPIPISLLTSTWRSLLNVPKEVNDVRDDLKEADVLTGAYLETLELDAADEHAFERLLENQEGTTFEFMSMDGTTLLPLCPGGHNLGVRFANKAQFVRLVKKLREKELISSNRVAMILAGLSTVLPLPLLSTFTSSDLRSRVSGSPEINLSLLKAHTHYQMGINESDRHIQFFWTALESMTPEELRNFVKFATNQDRLPTSCPCQNSPKLSTAVHVPPFPMKLAIIDMPHGATERYINSRTIRAETCLFLIQMPPYTTYQVTRDQLLYACNSHDDPLSG